MVSDNSVFTLYMKIFNHVGEHNTTKYEGTDNCAVTDNVLMYSALPPATKTHSSYQVKLQKEVKSTQKQPSCKKRCGPCKNCQHEKIVKSKVVAQKWL